MRKNGSLFDARMYVSPLIDAKGPADRLDDVDDQHHRGQARARPALASHERFTTVLEGLDAAVSVLSVQQGELLFANRSYRVWFGADGGGHALLAGADAGARRRRRNSTTPSTASAACRPGLTDAGADTREVYVEAAAEVVRRARRYLQWTDGRLAQMLIATDVTARRRAEEQAASQTEKAQVTSRLVTMGEMASSVAHELNQPLTAITNYCNGMITRVRGEVIAGGPGRGTREDGAPGRARRADHPPHPRLREAQRAAAPGGAGAPIIDDAVELAGIELRRRNVSIHTYVAQRLPPLHVDPDPHRAGGAQPAEERRRGDRRRRAAAGAAQHRAARRAAPHPEEGGVVEFSVTDMGPGLKRGGDRPAVRGVLLDQARGPRDRTVAVPLDRRVAPRPDPGAEPQWNDRRRLPFSFTLPVESSRSEGPTPPP